MEENAQLSREANDMLTEIKRSCHEEAVERLDTSTKKILFENRMMVEKLKVQLNETQNLQRAIKEINEESKKLKREVKLNEQYIKEYAKEGFRQNKI